MKPFNHSLAALATALSLSACISNNGNVDDQGSGSQRRGSDVAVIDGDTGTGASTVDAGSKSGCESFKQANGRVTTSVDAACTDCAVQNAAAAIDDDLASPAELRVNGSVVPLGVTIRATAQSGVIFPAGRSAGLYLSAPGGSNQSYTLIIRTLSGGVVQEMSESSASNGVGSGFGSRFMGIRTQKPFDAVELFVSNTQTGGMPVFKVFEMCSDLR